MVVMLMCWDTEQNSFISTVGSPMFEWLQERGENPKLHFQENDVWIEFEDLTNAVLYKLTWGGR